MNSTTTLRCDVKAVRNTEVKLILFKKGTASFKQKKKPHFSPFAALRAYFTCEVKHNVAILLPGGSLRFYQHKFATIGDEIYPGEDFIGDSSCFIPE